MAFEEGSGPLMTLKAISVINTTCRPSKCREVAVQMYDGVCLNGCVYVGLGYLKLKYSM